MSIVKNERNEHLGKPAKDVITGFTGTITGFCQYMTGCDQYLITPKTEDLSKLPEPHWFDSNRVEIVEGETLKLDNSQEDGPDKPAPKY